MTLAEALALMREIIAVYEKARDVEREALPYARRVEIPDNLCVTTTDGQSFKVQYIFWNYSDTEFTEFASVEDWRESEVYLRYARGERKVRCSCFFVSPVVQCDTEVIVSISDAKYDYPWICDRCKAQGRTKENRMDAAPIFTRDLGKVSS